MEIKNVLICGLGALGLTYANKLKNVCNLKILVDEARFKKFQKNPTIFNDEVQTFEYILPTQQEKADLIIIATKASGLCDAIKYIENFVTENPKEDSVFFKYIARKQCKVIYENKGL